jgi:hypothetical protein
LYTLGRSGVAITCREEGFVVRAPKDEAFDAAFKQVASSHGMEPEGLVRIRHETARSMTTKTACCSAFDW